MTQRFVVGIDLGTTNSALAYVETSEPAESARVVVAPIAQLVSAGEVAARPLLPSFMYLPGSMDFPAGSTALPWDPSTKKPSMRSTALPLVTRPLEISIKLCRFMSKRWRVSAASSVPTIPTRSGASTIWPRGFGPPETLIVRYRFMKKRSRS